MTPSSTLISLLVQGRSSGELLGSINSSTSNVFCRRLEDVCVPEMNTLYRKLEDAGIAGFHFVVSWYSQDLVEGH
jgi:hypothetical protein